VRHIIAEALKARRDDLPVDWRQLKEVRLAPALRLAARAIVEGKLEAIDRLARLRPGPLARVYDENARGKLLAKLNLNCSGIGAAAQTSENMPRIQANH
jgi:hypothetical protein